MTDETETSASELIRWGYVLSESTRRAEGRRSASSEIHFIDDANWGLADRGFWDVKMNVMLLLGRNVSSNSRRRLYRGSSSPKNTRLSGEIVRKNSPGSVNTNTVRYATNMLTRFATSDSSINQEGETNGVSLFVVFDGTKIRGLRSALACVSPTAALYPFSWALLADF